MNSGNVNGLLAELSRGLKRLWREGNRRQLALRDADKRALLRIPLNLAVLLALFLLWKATPLLIVALIVALFLKVQFAVEMVK